MLVPQVNPIPSWHIVSARQSSRTRLPPPSPAIHASAGAHGDGWHAILVYPPTVISSVPQQVCPVGQSSGPSHVAATGVHPPSLATAPPSIGGGVVVSRLTSSELTSDDVPSFAPSAAASMLGCAESSPQAATQNVALSAQSA